MTFLFDIMVTGAEGVNIYNVYLVDEIAMNFYVSPQWKSKPYWFHNFPEFYLAQVNKHWKSEGDTPEEYSYVSEWLLKQVSEAIENYYFELRFKRSKDSSQ